MHPRLKVEPPQTWYYRTSPNFHTLVILLHVDPTFGDEIETDCEGLYETKDTSILHGLQFPMLDTIIGCMVRFVDYLLIRWII